MKNMKKRFVVVSLMMLLMFILAAPVSSFAARTVVKKNKQPGYTVSNYYSKKKGKLKYLYSAVNLVVKSNNKKEILTKKNVFRIAKSDVKKIVGKDGKKVKFAKLKKGTRIRVIFDGDAGIAETAPMQFSKILRIELR